MAKEKVVETYLREQAKSLGGKAYKCVSPGNDGMPDRMVCLPVERIAFVETKAPGKTSAPLQKKKHAELRAMGFKVYADVKTKERVDTLLKEMLQ